MIIYGKQVCLHALEHHSAKIKTVYVANKTAKGKEVLPKQHFHDYHDKIKFLEEKWAMSMCKGGNHQGILVEMDEFEETPFSEIKHSSFIVILDGLTDVGNIGAIIRSAYALGADAILVTGVRQLNFAAIARTSAGAMLEMPLMISPNILDNINELKQQGFVCYGASLDGRAVQEMHFASKRILILGSEDKGISGKVSSKLDHKISIEMKNAFDSLNVSAAASILIHRMAYALK